MEQVIKKDDDKKSYTVEELRAIIASFTRAIQTLSPIHSTLMMDVRDNLAQVEEHYKCT